jgi:hypothetical protein
VEVGVKHRLGLFSENLWKTPKLTEKCSKPSDLSKSGQILPENAENPAALEGNGVSRPKLRLQPQKLT